MHSDDEEYSDSDSDSDDGFNEDMEYLRKACISAGANPNDLTTTKSDGGATTLTTGATLTSSDEDDDAEDDIEYVKNLQKRFGNSDETLTLKPSLSLELDDDDDDDDCEDDFRTLRAIQRRFSAYDNGGLKESDDSSLHKPEQVGDTNKIASEKEASNNLFVERNNDAEKGFPDCVDTDNLNPPNPGEDGLVVDTDLVEWHDSGAENAAASPLKTSSLPKPALAFIDAIKKNRSCQKAIRSKLMQLEARMEEIKKLKERVKILKDFQVGCKKRTSQALSQKKDARVQLISAAKQRPSSKLTDKNPAHYGPPENCHAAIYREALTRFPMSVIRERWSKKESENLAKGLKQQVQEMLLQQYVNSLNDADGSPGDGSDFDNVIASLRDREITPQNIRSFLPKINWEQLASMYVPNRSGAECLARWLNWEDPLINRDPWKTVEEKDLLYIIQQKGMSNWIDIATSLGTNRTPFQCLAHYQRSLNASIIRREWTKDEDDILRAAVEEYGESHWQVAASLLEGRTGTQCSNRWKKTLHPARKRIGKWTSEEDKRLKVAVKLFGTKWWKIAEFVPGRMQSQCRERWVNTLDPSLNLKEWTPEEDLMLEEAMKENGYCWSLVAACIPGRTDNQCRRRWMILFPEEVDMLRQAKKMQKAALISNFVDREDDRPSLGPKDFLQLPEIDQSSEPEYVNPSVKKKKKMFRKSRNHTAKDTSASNTFPEEVPGAANATEPEDGQAVRTSRRDLVRAGKGSRQQKRKSTADDGITVKNKRLKSRSNRKKSARSDTAECDLSSLPNSTSEVANNKVKRHVRKKIKNVNKKIRKPYLRDEPDDPCNLGERNAPEDSRITSEADERGGNDKFNDVPQTQSLPPRSEQADIPKSGNNRYNTARKGFKNKKSKFRDDAGSSMVTEAEEDNMASGSSLARLLNLAEEDNPITSTSPAESCSTEVQCTTTSNSPAGVKGRNRTKRARTRDETSSCSFKRLKKTRTEPARNIDDNITRLPVCQESEEPTRTNHMEVPDDMTLSVFWKKKKRSVAVYNNNNISLVCEESEEPTRTEPVEIPDEMTLSGFCKKVSSNDHNTNSLVCKESEEPTRTKASEIPDDMTLSGFCKRMKKRRGQPAKKN